MPQDLCSNSISYNFCGKIDAMLFLFHCLRLYKRREIQIYRQMNQQTKCNEIQELKNI